VAQTPRRDRASNAITVVGAERSGVLGGGANAALTFTNSYLAYTYGHATAEQLHDLTPHLRAAIAANPPRVPATVRALHPCIASLALTPHRAGWFANANVTDGQDTYQVISLLERFGAEWLAVTPRSAG
jgi:hypothetical protein